MRDLNWYLHFYSQPSVIAQLKDHLAQQPLPVVIDHFGGARAVQGLDQPGFDAVVDLVRTGRAYIKISGANRISQQDPDFPDAAPLAQALVKANPDRVLWGTDWPHLNPAYGRGKPLTEISPPLPIDDGMVLNQLPKWVPDPPTLKKIRQPGTRLRLRTHRRITHLKQRSVLGAAISGLNSGWKRTRKAAAAKDFGFICFTD
jgi:hypothetical protein